MLYCPQCGEELLEAFCSPGYERSVFGDYFCDVCPPNRVRGLFCYWWEHELVNEERNADE